MSRVLKIVFLVLGLVIATPSWAEEKAEVVIDGIEGEPRENVAYALALPRDLIREGKVDRLWLERLGRQAEAKTRRALEPFGYYNARVSASVEREQETSRIRVKVEPGEPVRLAGVNVAVRGPGEQERSLERLAREFPLRKGDVLLQQQYEEAKGNLKARAQELGYLDADYSSHEIRISKAEAAAEIDLVMETGLRYYFDGVRIEGASQYPERFLRRYIAFKPGEVFSYGKLGETQLNYTNAERFRQVLVRPEKENAIDGRVPVLVQLEALPRHTLHPGIGYGTDTGARFSIRYRDMNVWQRGHEFNANVYISEVLQGLATQYTIPSARDIKSSTGIQLNLQREDVSTYTSRLVAIEVSRNRSFRRGQLGTLYLRIQQEDFSVGGENSSSRLVLPGCRFSQERYDNLIRPTSGHRFAFDVRGTHEFLGSDTGLVQLIAEGSRLFPLPWRMLLFLKGKGALTAQNDPLAELPVSLRFFAGGDQSVRGYSYRSLGPRNLAGQVIGGRHLSVGSIELFRDLFESFAVSGFYDAGNSFNQFNAIRLYHGTGVGVHYYSPIGSINLYLARQLAVDEPAFHIHFTIGFQF